MTVYTVHLQSGDAEAAGAVFVPEGFAWSAFAVPPLWLLWHRLWLAAFGWCVLVLLVTVVPLGFSTPLKELFLLLIAVLCGLEARQLWRRKLTGEGMPVAEIVSGDTLQDAEIHFFHRWAERAPVLPPPPAVPRQTQLPSAYGSAHETPFGLFPEPEK